MSAMDASQLLGQDLPSASDDQLLRIVGLIDTLERRGAVDRLLDPVRHRLQLLRPPRPLTLRRVLALPFEDLLVPAQDMWPGRRRFSRAHIAGFLNHMQAALPKDVVAQLSACARGHTMAAAEVVLKIGAVLWPAAAAVLATEKGGPASGRPPVEPETVRHFAAAAPLLALGPKLVPMLWQLPAPPIPMLPRGAVEPVLEVLRAAAARGAEPLMWTIELLLARSLSPQVILDPLWTADLGLPAHERQAVLHQLIRSHIADLREAAVRLAASLNHTGRASATALLRLVLELDGLDDQRTTGSIDKRLLQDIRKTTSETIEGSIEAALGQDMLQPFQALGLPAGLDDDAMEGLEEAARNMRRLSIAGVQLGIAETAETLLSPFWYLYRDTVLHREGGSGNGQQAWPTSSLFDQLRVVEILFGSDAAMRLYDALRGRGSA